MQTEPIMQSTRSALETRLLDTPDSMLTGSTIILWTEWLLSTPDADSTLMPPCGMARA